MAKKFNDDKYAIIKNDLEKIQKRPTMYISSIGTAGIFHLCKEVIDNNLDEVRKEESPGDSIYIEITDKYLLTRDNGRGIPTNILREVLETIQAGSNMTRAGGATSGENGVGSSCVVALSSLYEVTSLRPQEKKKLSLRYVNAKLVEEILEDYDGKDHGLIVKFVPSKKSMGVDKIPVEDLVKWLQNFDYTLPKSINLKYKICGKENSVKYKWLREFFDIDIPKDKRISDILTGTFKGELDETFSGEVFHRHFNIEVAIMYASPEYKGDDIRQSWMNMIHTPQNGEHVDGVIRGFIKFMTEEVVRRNKKLAGEDLRKDILAHLQVVVKGTCDFAHMFSAQSKHEVLTVSKVLGKAIEKACYEWLNETNNSYGSLIEAIIGNHRVRIAGEQARELKNATRVNKKWETTNKYIPCSSIKSPMPKELFLVEGDSAAGGVNGARYPYQAILMFRGKTLNAYEGDPVSIINSESWKYLIPTLGCGVGDSFDIKKLKFDKIIICTDADIDGFHIRTEHMVFFKRFLPGIIDAGKLYIAEPPLYQLTQGKSISYVSSQTEYIQRCIDSIGDLKVSFVLKPDNKTSVREFVTDAFDYSNTLRECSIQRSVNRYLLEHIAYGLVQYKTVDNFIAHVDEWLRGIASIYKEIGFNHNTNQITATIDFIDQYVLIDQDLVDALSYIIRIQDKYGLIVKYESKKKGMTQQTELSYFFAYIEDIYPRITDRYKGLGTSDASALREVVTDPRTRRLMRVTTEDVRTYEKMGVLTGKSKENVNQRKELLMNFRFTPADIDN